MNPEEKNCCSKKVLKIVGVLLAIYLAVLSVKEIKSIGYVGTNPSQAHTISVDGTGDSVAIPNIATLSFTVTETAKTVAVAQDQATKKVNATIAGLKSAGIAENDIKTTSYNINPHYEYQTSVCTANTACTPSKTIVTGYDVSQSTDIKVHDLTKIGDLLTLIGSNGVQNVSGPSFSVENPDSVQAIARAKAIENAKSKADVLAKSLGVRIVRVISFSESNNTPYPVRFDMAVGMATASAPKAAPEISTGEQKITSNVSITYEIE